MTTTEIEKEFKPCIVIDHTERKENSSHQQIQGYGTQEV